MPASRRLPPPTPRTPSSPRRPSSWPLTSPPPLVLPPAQVYNLTPYLQYHPGGAKILMSVAGKDGTAAFDKYHAWVNADFLLSKCLVGKLEPAITGDEKKPAEQ